MNGNSAISTRKTFDVINNKLHSDDLCFVSLGFNCLPRILIDSLFDVRKMYSCDHRLPFDGSVHMIPKLFHILDTDFSHFSSMENLNFTKTKTGIKERQFENTFYNTRYLHEKPNETIEIFSQKQKKRVDAFKKLMNSGKKIVFLKHFESAIDRTKPYKLSQLYKSIKKLFPQTDFYIIALSKGLTNSVEYNKNVCVIQLPVVNKERFNEYEYTFKETEWGIECLGFLFSTIFKVLKFTIYPQMNLLDNLNLLNNFILPKLKESMVIPLDKENRLSIKEAEIWIRFKSLNDFFLISINPKVKKRLKDLCGDEDENS